MSESLTASCPRHSDQRVLSAAYRVQPKDGAPSENLGRFAILLPKAQTCKEAFAKEVLELYKVRGACERAEKILRDGKAAPLKRLRRNFEELIAVGGPKAKPRPQK
jgi:hypothetical protein